MGCRLRHNDSNCVPFHTRAVGYDIRCPISISDIRYLISDIRYLISDVRYLYLTSGILSDIRYLISDIWYLISDIRYLIRHPVSYIRHPVSISDIRYLYPTSDIYIRRPISISDVRYRYLTSDTRNPSTHHQLAVDSAFLATPLFSGGVAVWDAQP